MSEPRTHPVRTCVGCRQRAVQAELVRLQIDAGGELVAVDHPGPGRSAYVHPGRQCIEALVKSKGLERSLRRRLAAEVRQRACAALQTGACDPRKAFVQG